MTDRRRYLIIGTQAEDDYVNVLRESVRSWGVESASEYRAELDAALDRLEHYSELGQRVDYLIEGVRSMRVRRHRVFYTVDERSVIVLRILHERQHVSRVVLAGDEDENR